MAWLLQQHGLLLVNMCNLEIKIYRTFNSYNESEDDCRSFVFNELLEDGALVPKDVEVST
jgi:hypothetical protein